MKKMFFFYIICCCIQFQIFAQCHIDDWTALKALYESTDGDNWENKQGWEQMQGDEPPADCDLSNIHGVIEMDEYGIRIESFFLPSNNLIGTIPGEICSLNNVKQLSLVFNSLTGTIPNCIGELTELFSLSLDFNQLTGSIPPELGNLPNLSFLTLFDNQLSGEIPPGLGNLPLFRLDLSYNQLTGEIPIGLATNGRRYVLRLIGNQLTGCIPPEFGDAFFDWTSLSLDGNNLSGCYDANLLKMCDPFDGIYGFEDPFSSNDLDATFEEFCFEGKGICDTIAGCRPKDTSPMVGIFNCE